MVGIQIPSPVVNLIFRITGPVSSGSRSPNTEYRMSWGWEVGRDDHADTALQMCTEEIVSCP